MRVCMLDVPCIVMPAVSHAGELTSIDSKLERCFLDHRRFVAQNRDENEKELDTNLGKQYVTSMLLLRHIRVISPQQAGSQETGQQQRQQQQNGGSSGSQAPTSQTSTVPLATYLSGLVAQAGGPERFHGKLMWVYTLNDEDEDAPAAVGGSASAIDEISWGTWRPHTVWHCDPQLGTLQAIPGAPAGLYSINTRLQRAWNKLQHLMLGFNWLHFGAEAPRHVSQVVPLPVPVQEAAGAQRVPRTPATVHDRAQGSKRRSLLEVLGIKSTASKAKRSRSGSRERSIPSGKGKGAGGSKGQGMSRAGKESKKARSTSLPRAPSGSTAVTTSSSPTATRTATPAASLTAPSNAAHTQKRPATLRQALDVQQSQGRVVAGGKEQQAAEALVGMHGQQTTQERTQQGAEEQAAPPIRCTRSPSPAPSIVSESGQPGGSTGAAADQQPGMRRQSPFKRRKLAAASLGQARAPSPLSVPQGAHGDGLQAHASVSAPLAAAVTGKNAQAAQPQPASQPCRTSTQPMRRELSLNDMGAQAAQEGVPEPQVPQAQPSAQVETAAGMPYAHPGAAEQHDHPDIDVPLAQRKRAKLRAQHKPISREVPTHEKAPAPSQPPAAEGPLGSVKPPEVSQAPQASGQPEGQPVQQHARSAAHGPACDAGIAPVSRPASSASRSNHQVLSQLGEPSCQPVHATERDKAAPVTSSSEVAQSQAAPSQKQSVQLGPAVLLPPAPGASRKHLLLPPMPTAAKQQTRSKFAAAHQHQHQPAVLFAAAAAAHAAAAGTAGSGVDVDQETGLPLRMAPSVQAVARQPAAPCAPNLGSVAVPAPVAAAATEVPAASAPTASQAISLQPVAATLLPCAGADAVHGACGVMVEEREGDGASRRSSADTGGPAALLGAGMVRVGSLPQSLRSGRETCSSEDGEGQDRSAAAVLDRLVDNLVPLSSSSSSDSEDGRGGSKGGEGKGVSSAFRSPLLRRLAAHAHAAVSLPHQAASPQKSPVPKHLAWQQVSPAGAAAGADVAPAPSGEQGAQQVVQVPQPEQATEAAEAGPGVSGGAVHAASGSTPSIGPPASPAPDATQPAARPSHEAVAGLPNASPSGAAPTAAPCTSDAPPPPPPPTLLDAAPVPKETPNARTPSPQQVSATTPAHEAAASTAAAVNKPRGSPAAEGPVVGPQADHSQAPQAGLQRSVSPSPAPSLPPLLPLSRSATVTPGASPPPFSPLFRAQSPPAHADPPSSGHSPAAAAAPGSAHAVARDSAPAAARGSAPVSAFAAAARMVDAPGMFSMAAISRSPSPMPAPASAPAQVQVPPVIRAAAARQRGPSAERVASAEVAIGTAQQAPAAEQQIPTGPPPQTATPLDQLVTEAGALRSQLKEQLARVGAWQQAGQQVLVLVVLGNTKGCVQNSDGEWLRKVLPE